MSIRPPSDIVLDVVQAADPLRYKDAAGRLNKAAYAAPAEGFDAVFKEVVRQPPLQLPFDSMAASTRMRTNSVLRPEAHQILKAEACAPGGGAPDMAAARKFEAMALTGMVETMLPAKADSVFGGGAAGQIWKSMLAEQIAGQIAKGGGLGIAAMLAKGSGEAAPDSAGDVAAALNGTGQSAGFATSATFAEAAAAVGGNLLAGAWAGAFSDDSET